MKRTPASTLLVASTVAALSGGCNGRAYDQNGAPDTSPLVSLPEPAGCHRLSPGPLAERLASVPEGEAACLLSGTFTGPVIIKRRVHLWGPSDAVVSGIPNEDLGSVITVAAAGTTLEGFTVDGAGGRFDRFDAAVHVLADDVTVRGLTIVRPVYGILVEKAHRAAVVDNQIIGDHDGPMGLRGDTIRLWETHDSKIERNVVHDGRDMVVWYSSHNHIAHNTIRGGRYGTHFMYSHDNLVESNSFRGGVVGVFVMYSHRVRLNDNLVSDLSGAGGMGIGLKDANDIDLDGNLVVRGAIGVYVDQTPGDDEAHLTISGNIIRQCDTAIQFHTTPHRTTIRDNDFADNIESFKAAGGSNMRDATWTNNFYDNYAGYDLDDDGIGDMPFEWQSASEDLIASYPDVAFFRGSPVLGVLDAGSRLLPIARPRVLLSDPRPRVASHDLDRWTRRFAADPWQPRARPVVAPEPLQPEAH